MLNVCRHLLILAIFSRIITLEDDPGLEDEVKKANTMPFYLGAFELSNSERILNNFIHPIDGFYANDVY